MVRLDIVHGYPETFKVAEEMLKSIADCLFLIGFQSFEWSQARGLQKVSKINMRKSQKRLSNFFFGSVESKKKTFSLSGTKRNEF